MASARCSQLFGFLGSVLSGNYKAERLEKAFQQAEDANAQILDRERAMKTGISKMKMLLESQRQAIAASGGTKSQTVKSRGLIELYLTTNAAMKAKERELKSSEDDRAIDETKMAGLRLAHKAQVSESKNNPINVLYAIINPSVDHLDRAKQREMNQIETLGEYNDAFNDHKSAAGSAANVSSQDADDAMEDLKMYELSKEENDMAESMSDVPSRRVGSGQANSSSSSSIVDGGFDSISATKMVNRNANASDELDTD